MLGKPKDDVANYDRDSSSLQQIPRAAVASSPAPEVSSISAGLSIVGKIVGHGAVTIFGHVQGELRASTVVIAEGAEMEGDVVAEELTIGGHLKGTIHANRVKLNSTAVVDGDIFHRTLAIEESARFEGTSRRNEKAIDSSSRVQMDRAQLEAASTNANRKGNSAPDGLSR
jgi:cytoskeletal protein CcmA (bactofilin family)